MNPDSHSFYFSEKSKLFWRKPAHLREFLSYLGSTAAIAEPEDWESISLEDVLRSGGYEMIRQYGSLYFPLKLAFFGTLTLTFFSSLSSLYYLSTT